MNLEPDWHQHLQAEFEKPYMLALRAFLRAEKDQRKIIYPASKDCFNALNFTGFDHVKIVILGQDPYHGAGQAHGLSFSVPVGVKIPPSLDNIYKELAADVGFVPVKHGYLVSWAQQGVLLLNSVLTVEAGKANAHQGKGWETFTDRIIELINEQHRHVVFLLWGAYAQKKGAMIDTQKHLVLKTVHPSPLSAYRGFLGCRHFSQANAYLVAQGKAPIDWQLPEY